MRWFWQRKEDDGDKLKVTPTSRRLDDLEDAVEHLNRRFKRLQQQVTRWAQEFDDDVDGDDVDDFDDLLAEKRRAK
jgi:predicted  nucleic acid-binding Zn-ribbon protein